MAPHRATNKPRAGRRPQSRLIFSEAIPSRTEAIDPTVSSVLSAVGATGCVDGQREAIEVALREALVNAVVHGNRYQAKKRVEVDCFAEGERTILLVVRDEGSGFDPSKLVDPTLPENIARATGRGIYLIRRFMDEVEFQRGGREIRMKKKT